MKPEYRNAVVEIWAEPATMNTGAPEPVLVLVEHWLWVAYRAYDPNFPGYTDPAAADYLAAHPGDPFAVLSFEGVSECRIGGPSNERLHEHPLYGRGLEYYGFHRVRDPDERAPLWIVTFHDETLEVRARAARAVAMQFVPDAEDAIRLARNSHALLPHLKRRGEDE